MRKKKTSILIPCILVENYAAEGKSLARVNGKVYFIENAVPGDVIDLRVTKNKKDWGEGFPQQFIQYSNDRIPPFCSHFGVCGGCQWQMLPYTKQLQYKQQQVADSLQRIAKVPLPDMLPIIGCEETKYYRNKLEYTFAASKYIPDNDFRKQKELSPDSCDMPGAAGFHAKGFFDKVVEIDVCHLQNEPTNEIRKYIAQFSINKKIPFYNIREHFGWLRIMQVRMTTTGELMINIMFGDERPALQKELLDALVQQFTQITTLLYTVNVKYNDSMQGLTPQVYHGKGYVIEQLGNYRFKISPKSFFQTNSRQAEKLYNITRDFAELDGNQTVYDLYCGTGSIGIFISGQAKKVVGVEVIEEAIEDAKENAALNNIQHTHFFAGDVIDICDDAFFAQHGHPDVIIADPPRAGMHEKLAQKLLTIAADTIVYVSCNPATQARDLALLCEKYTVTKIQPVDMFPHTLHIENVVQLKLRIVDK